jgi:hypothetical protein
LHRKLEIVNTGAKENEMRNFSSERVFSDFNDNETVCGGRRRKLCNPLSLYYNNPHSFAKIDAPVPSPHIPHPLFSCYWFAEVLAVGLMDWFVVAFPTLNLHLSNSMAYIVPAYILPDHPSISLLTETTKINTFHI